MSTTKVQVAKPSSGSTPWRTVIGAGIGAALMVGLFAAALLGRAGLALGAVLVMLIGNPWAGLFAPREFLIEPMATVGALMPNGAIATLLRSISFFPGAATGSQWLILSIWAVVGLCMIMIGAALPGNQWRKAPATTAVTGSIQ